MRAILGAELKKLGRKQKWTAGDAVTIVEAWRRSESPLAACSRAMGVGEQRIRNWRDGKNEMRIGRSAKAPSVVPVKITGTTRVPVADRMLSDPRSETSRTEIELSRGRTIRIGVDFDASAVARLVTTLEQLGC